MSRFLALLLIIFTCCDFEEGIELTIDTNQRSEAEAVTLTEHLSSLEVSSENSSHAALDEHLFGKFYNDRIAFHIVDEPDTWLYQARVNRLTLYYIDGVLCRKKFELDRNISDELAIQLGAMSYKSLDYSTDSLAREMGIVLYSPQGNRLNPYLHKFQLKWKNEDKTIVFRHLKDSINVSNLYIEEIKNYRKLYKSVQRDLL